MSVKQYAVMVCLVATGACASGSAEKGSSPAPVVSVNPDFKVDQVKAEAGGEIWRQKACFVCHTVGAQSGSARGTAPDLSGVVERRDVEWIKKFLSDTDRMIQTDPIATALYEQYNKQKMPNMHVTEEQIEALTHYLQQQTEKKRS
jgi:protein SCO1